jgi:hypothetical protein
MFSAPRGSRSYLPRRPASGFVRPRVPAVGKEVLYPIRWAVLGVAAALLTGCLVGSPPAADGQGESLEGIWEVTSVQRDGEPDPLPVGGRMTFTGTAVTFQPKAVQVVDYAS